MSSELPKLIDEAHKRITEALAQGKRPVVAYSGGKDGLVAAHLVAQHGITRGICEMSFYYTQQKADIRATAARLGLDIAFEERRNDEWLRRHQEFFFSSSPAIRSRSFSLRQQRTVKQYAKEHGHDMIIFGRRADHNTVKAGLYEVDNYLSFHPIREWKEHHIWEYLEATGIGKPWIYTTVIANYMGNGPFYSFRAAEVGGVDHAWRMVSALDPTITRERYAPLV